MPSDVELILRLLVAAALAGALGLERELTDQPAGFRTHILVGLGAALFTVISAFGFRSVLPLGPGETLTQDPTRIAAQIVVGIGFLGGGAIIKYGATVRGLTTAASLWVTAAVGTAVGAGELALGAATAGIALVAIVGLRPLRKVIRRFGEGLHEFVIEAAPGADLVEVMSTMQQAGATIRSAGVSDEGGEREIRLQVRVSPGSSPAQIAATLSRIEHVRSVDWRD